MRDYTKPTLLADEGGAMVRTFGGCLATLVVGLGRGILDATGTIESVPELIYGPITYAAPLLAGIFTASTEYGFGDQKERLRAGTKVTAFAAATEAIGYITGQGAIAGIEYLVSS